MQQAKKQGYKLKPLEVYKCLKNLNLNWIAVPRVFYLQIRGLVFRNIISQDFKLTVQSQK